MNIETEADILASSNFLNIEFPDNYGHMDREELLQFINENKKYFLEDSSPLAVAELIEALAKDFISFNSRIEQFKLQEVVQDYLGKMVQANMVNEQQSSQYYADFVCCQKELGGQKAFEKLNDMIDTIKKS